MSTIDFRHGALIRSGPKLANGGKWDAMLDDSMRNNLTNAELTIYISVHFDQINPIPGQASLYPDSNDGSIDPSTGKTRSSKRKIQRWAPGEFGAFKRNLLHGAQKFWDGVFWLKTPSTYRWLDWPEANPTHRCHLYCKLRLSEAKTAGDAHYTIAVVRAKDGENFRSNSRLYSQHDIQSENLIRHSTTKFWTHYHEVGHLLGLGHVNHRDLHTSGLNSPAAYGVGGTLDQQQDVMGMGSVKHSWHARPWQEAAAALTETKKDDWHLHIKQGSHHLMPTLLMHGQR